MPYLKSLSITTDKTNPFPYKIAAVRYARSIDLSNKVTFFIGDNGCGKSTLLESLAFRLQLPHMDGGDYSKNSFQAAVKLSGDLDLSFNIDRPRGFFFRAEDFGDYLNSVSRRNTSLYAHLDSLEHDIPTHVIQQMKENANYQIHHMRENYGQELSSFSHGEAYLKIIDEKVKGAGIYILDEPEAALSPAKQLSLIYQMADHLSHNMSQFIIATHSPIIMSYPEATIYEITEDSMLKTDLDETEHYRITKGFLNNPDLYIRHLME